MIEISKDLPPIGHVGYIVADVDKNVSKYRCILGIDNFKVYDYVPRRVWVRGRELFTCKLRIAIGTLKSGIKIELIQPVEGATPHAQFLNEKGPGLHHIAFYTERYDEWLEYFKKAGADITFEAEAEDAIIGYRRSFYAQIAGMVGLVEITEVARKRK